LPDVDNVKGGALAAASCVPKTSVLSKNFIKQGFGPAFFVSETRMATAADLRRIALALPGTSEAPHFDRTAFKVKRIYATLAADGLTANLKLTPDEQAFKILLAPEIFAAIGNGWGRQGWTTVYLTAASEADLQAALEMAHATPCPPPGRASASISASIPAAPDCSGPRAAAR
jgi:hypothetical protein